MNVIPDRSEEMCKICLYRLLQTSFLYWAGGSVCSWFGLSGESVCPGVRGGGSVVRIALFCPTENDIAGRELIKLSRTPIPDLRP